MRLDRPGLYAACPPGAGCDPLVHERGLYLCDGQITDTLPQEQQDFVDRFLWAEYWREAQGLSAK